MVALKERGLTLLESGLPAAFSQSGLPPAEKADLMERFRKTAERQREHLRLMNQLADDVEKGGLHVR